MQILYKLFILPIEYLFEFVFMFSWKRFHSAGVAIIAVSLIINFLVLPIYRKADSLQDQERSKQSHMSAWLKHIRNAFSGDERFMRLNAYYREESYRPIYALRSLFPLLLQIPFFIAAYHFLSSRSEISGVSFLFLSDLGKPDGLLKINTLTINLLPLIMTLFNMISGILYMRGFPIKSKIQHYLLSLFFLVFLFQSPSGLVFYWTLNNAFSLLKNVFLKHIRNPKKYCDFLLLILGCSILLYLIHPNNCHNMTDLLYALIIFLICAAPFLFSLAKLLFPCLFATGSSSDKKCFPFSSQIYLTILWGLWIPLSVISSSPGEFVDVLHFRDPLHYVFDNFLICSGAFLLWGSIFCYFLSERCVKTISAILWLFCGIFTVNFLLFGRNLGTMSPQLSFDHMFDYSGSQIVFNLIVLFFLTLSLLYLFLRHPKIQHSICLAAIIAGLSISIFSVKNTEKQLSEMSYLRSSSDTPDFHIPLSRNGHNVVIFTLDRAMSVFIPFILYERPDLIDRYSGFVYYPNTLSYGTHTLSASKAMMGGYDYTPLELNDRFGNNPSNDATLLAEQYINNSYEGVQIQDEALKVMPSIFANAGFDVRICDPPYAGGQTIGDLSIFDNCEGVKAYHLAGHYNTLVVGNDDRMMHHFFFYSIFKSAPLIFQKDLYQAGTYYYSEGTGNFVRQNFLDAYGVLQSLIYLTDVSDSDANTLLIMNNDTTHDTAELQLPEYEPALVVDNTGLETGFRSDGNGKTIPIGDFYYLYHGNMAALLKIADWLDYLKLQGCYDNTRIIIVADHGFPYEGFPEYALANDASATSNMPLFMVKDFNRQGSLYTSHDFMTNADTPVIAMSDLINHPVNPFTGKEITNDVKFLPYQTVVTGDGIYRVHDNILDINNWDKTP